MFRATSGIATVIVLICAPAFAAEPIIYPAKGQSAEQLKKDKGECSVWATESTGIDPLAVAQSQADAPKAAGRQGERVKGAVRGAAAGAVVGAVAGDAGKGAAVGAAGGTVVGGARQRRTAEAEKAGTEAAKDTAKADLETYTRAYGACLEGRGYTVK